MTTVSQLRCLLTAVELDQTCGKVTSSAIAKKMGISKPSVHRLVGAIQKKGYVSRESYQAVQLTDEGRQAAKALQLQADWIAGHLREGLQLDSSAAGTGALLLIAGMRDKLLPDLPIQETE